MSPLRIFYNSHATPEVYAMIREAMPAGFELVTLEADSDEERRRRIAGCEVAICASRPLAPATLAAASKLRLVHHQGVGYQDTVDWPALKARGIRLALTPAGTTTGVAEHTVLLMLAVAKRLPFADAELRQGRFHINALRAVSCELAGRTVGYVGMGRIGQAVAARLRAFETRGVYFDPAVALPAADSARLGVRRVVALDGLLASADIVTLHLPLTPQTRHLIDRERLARMKRGAILVNTARGGLVDEAALVEALRSGHLAGAGLDVFETEPLPAAHPLTTLPNVVLTPHVSAGTRDAMKTKFRALFDNIERFVRGEPLADEVT